MLINLFSFLHIPTSLLCFPAVATFAINTSVFLSSLLPFWRMFQPHGLLQWNLSCFSYLLVHYFSSVFFILSILSVLDLLVLFHIVNLFLVSFSVFTFLLNAASDNRHFILSCKLCSSHFDQVHWVISVTTVRLLREWRSGWQTHGI